MWLVFTISKSYTTHEICSPRFQSWSSILVTVRHTMISGQNVHCVSSIAWNIQPVCCAGVYVCIQPTACLRYSRHQALLTSLVVHWCGNRGATIARIDEIPCQRRLLLRLHACSLGCTDAIQISIFDTSFCCTFTHTPISLHFISNIKYRRKKEWLISLETYRNILQACESSEVFCFLDTWSDM